MTSAGRFSPSRQQGVRANFGFLLIYVASPLQSQIYRMGSTGHLAHIAHLTPCGLLLLCSLFPIYRPNWGPSMGWAVELFGGMTRYW